MRAFVKPTSLFTINEIVTFPDISHVKYLNFGQRGAALVQLMLSPLVLSVTHFNPSLKISSSTQKRIKLPLSNFENFIPSGNQVCINHMSFITHKMGMSTGERLYCSRVSLDYLFLIRPGSIFWE